MSQIFFKPLVVDSTDGVAVCNGQFIYEKSTQTLYVDWDGMRHKLVGGECATNFTVSCESGDEPSVAITDSDGTKNLHFVLPKGEQGIQGIQGLQGEKGEQGEKGDKGDSADNVVAGENISVDLSSGAPVISAGPFTEVLYSGNQTMSANIGDAQTLEKYKMLFVKGVFSNSSSFQVCAVLDPQSSLFGKVFTLSASTANVTVKTASLKVDPPFLVSSAAVQGVQTTSANSAWTTTNLSYYITEVLGLKK